MTGSPAPPSPPVEPKRIRQFREGLVKALPKFPNDRPTRDALLDMSLAQLLIHYCNWRLRFIRPAPRTVTADDAVTSDPRYAQLQPAIDALLTKAWNGEDLSPHLSLQVDSKGFTLAATGPNLPPPAPQIDRWADKDFLLNVMGFHHLHLGTTLEAAGHVRRTNEVLFVQVTRDTFEAVMILDHSVFEVDPDGGMTPERTRLWTTFDKRSSRGVPAGTPYIATMVSLSGHPMRVSMYCGDLAHFIIDTEAKLNDYEYVKSLYNRLEIEIPPKPKLTMHMNGLDFGLIEASTNTFWNMNKGWI